MKEKKIWSPELLPNDQNLLKKWFVEYYEPIVGTTKGKRIKVYENLNRLKTVEERLRLGNIIIRRIRKNKPITIQLKKPKASPVIQYPKSILLEALNASNNYIDKKTYSTYRSMALRWIEFLGPIARHEAQSSCESGLQRAVPAHFCFAIPARSGPGQPIRTGAGQ